MQSISISRRALLSKTRHIGTDFDENDTGDETMRNDIKSFEPCLIATKGKDWFLGIKKTRGRGVEVMVCAPELLPVQKRSLLAPQSCRQI